MAVRIEWRRGSANVQFKNHGYNGTKHIAEIHKRQNHTYVNEDIYRVFVLGSEVGGPFRHIDDARQAAERVFQQRMAA